MAGRQAKIITAPMLERMLRHVKNAPTWKRDQVLLLLSARAGLRACEIARLEWNMLLGPSGKLGDVINVHDRIAKKGGGRRIPMHHDLRRALLRLQAHSELDGPVIRSVRGGQMRANSIVNWFVALGKTLELDGCSSHSGRRTFITATARNLARTGGSLRDVQLLAGHRSIETTQRYIDGDSITQRKLVAMI